MCNVQSFIIIINNKVVIYRAPTPTQNQTDLVLSLARKRYEHPDHRVRIKKRIRLIEQLLHNPSKKLWLERRKRKDHV